MTSNWQILIVEDDPDSREMVTGLLRHNALDCIPVSTGEAALDQLAYITPTLILIDLALPGMDGWTLLQELQDHPEWRTIPRVAMTAYHTVELAEKALNEGFTAYFAKPIDAVTFARELIAVIKNHI